MGRSTRKTKFVPITTSTEPQAIEKPKDILFELRNYDRIQEEKARQQKELQQKRLEEAVKKAEAAIEQSKKLEAERIQREKETQKLLEEKRQLAEKERRQAKEELWNKYVEQNHGKLVPAMCKRDTTDEYSFENVPCNWEYTFKISKDVESPVQKHFHAAFCKSFYEINCLLIKDARACPRCYKRLNNAGLLPESDTKYYQKYRACLSSEQEIPRKENPYAHDPSEFWC